MLCEALFDLQLVLGEGPIWSAAHNKVFFVDILAHSVYSGDLDGTASEIARFDEPVSALVITEGDEILALTSTGLYSLDRSCVHEHKIAPSLRTNDGKVSPDGRFVFGTMSRTEPLDSIGSLWSTNGHQLQQLATEITISNGLAWNASGDLMYYIDTPTQRIDVFDYDQSNGSVSNRRAFVEIDSSLGHPDGMAIDSEGTLWVALWGGSALHRYDQGQLVEKIAFPTPYVTCPTFAGPNLDLLVVTTASQPFHNHAPKGAGAVYVVADAAQGTAQHKFKSFKKAAP